MEQFFFYFQAQYIFLHHALLEYLILGNVEIKNIDFKQAYTELTKEKNGVKFMHQQFHVRCISITFF